MFTESPPATADVVVIGAGLVGACCGYELAARGLSVVVVERGSVAAGTTAAGEGNLLVSDKRPGPELDLARLSLDLWRELPGLLAHDLRRDVDIELEDKGGLMVARTEAAAKALRALAADQRAAGTEAEEVDADRLLDLEPHLTRDVAAAVWYPADAQVQPVLAATAILAAAAARGASVVPYTEVTGIGRTTDGLTVRTRTGSVSTPHVVVAAGPWSGRIAGFAGRTLPVEPRRGVILVTEPLPPIVRHKVYDAGYIAEVDSDETGLSAAAVVESTRSGTVLIGSTRERRGFGADIPVSVLRTLAAGALALFPALGVAQAMRAYGGFRPYSPDHLPVIGPDPELPGLWYASGHEGAGIGLAPATGRLIGELVGGQTPSLDPAPFAADRPGLSSPSDTDDPPARRGRGTGSPSSGAEGIR
ncbi:MAG: FAD-binding oxidoreductase [Actinocatenispora sp.]